jgi:hypothetical protein
VVERVQAVQLETSEAWGLVAMELNLFVLTQDLTECPEWNFPLFADFERKEGREEKGPLNCGVSATPDPPQPDRRGQASAETGGQRACQGGMATQG